ncbi:imm11 family protein [Candidatus Pristimantibacillus sp. PTI5]|uniref:imm11 family protein n=1 Tax=Candidatus Pristimantibacillus sp. PTI5 TaxID=3400422 RepID=UPI003B013003
MKVWELLSSDKSIVIIVSNREEDRKKINFNGENSVDWQPIKFKTTIKRKIIDFPNFTKSVPVLSKSSLSILKTYINPYVELLPIEHEYELFLVNVTNVIDCVDYARSEYDVMPSGRFGGFNSLYFHEHCLQDEWIFKIPEKVNTSVYVTDKFRDLVIQFKLQGFEFLEVWDSDYTEEIEKNKLLIYEQKLIEIEKSSDTKFKWHEAMERVKAGKAVASGKWMLQHNKTGTMMLGQLGNDLSYFWMNPVYLPPILFDLKYHEVEAYDI